MDKKFIIQFIVLLVVIFGGLLTIFNPATLGLPSIVPGGVTPGGYSATTATPAEKQQLLFIDERSTGNPELVKGIITVDVADDPNERAQGLSYRETMLENEGMIFLFPQAFIPKFIMREMRFSLDFVWVSGDRVVDLYENAPPEATGTPDSEMRTYSPSVDVDKVVEVNAGYIKKYGLKIGDRIKLEPIPQTQPQY